MQISAWLVYFASVAEGLKVLFIIGGMVLILGLIISFPYLSDSNMGLDISKKAIGKAICGGIIALLIGACIPTKRDIAAIVLIPVIVNNEKLQNITGNSLDTLELLIKEWLEDLKKGNEKTKERSL